ncbi:MAG: hypothetical protein DRJ42_26220 [Deltaproteobacteria bacterium]|nr:MAG: hypothetical protein DRJ42_26220 [Deltaproteobacteria bacterium]
MGEATRLDGERLDFVSPTPFAPGQPIRMSATIGGASFGIEGRSMGSKRRDDGRFDVRLRLMSTSRGRLERLAAAIDEAAGPSALQ